MKSILCLFFVLVAGALGVSGQVSRSGLSLPKPAAGWGDMPPIINIKRMTGARVRIMSPDHMPCLTPDLVLSERMPVQRMKSTDPMPNGIQQPDDGKIRERDAMLRRLQP